MLACALLAGCGDKTDSESPKGTGSSSDAYILTSWNGSTDLADNIYLQFHSDGTFELYQNINTATGFVKYTGHYTIEEKLLSGDYDSTGNTTIPWSSRYIIQTFTTSNLTIISADESITSVYSGTTIPDYVKEAAPTATPRSVRTAQQIPFL